MKQLLLLSACLMGTLLSAQNPIQLSLKQAMALSETNNADVRVQSLEKLVAKKVLLQNIAIGLPSVSVGGNYVDNIDLPSQFFDINQDGVIDELKFGTRYSSAGQLSVNQLVFDGSYFVAVLAADVLKGMADISYEQSVINARTATAKSYHMLVILQGNVDNVIKSLRIAADAVDDMQAMHDEGLVEQSDVDQLALNMGQLESALAYAQSMHAVNANLLKLQCGLSEDVTLQLTSSLTSLMLSANQGRSLLDTQFDVNGHVDFRALAVQRMGQSLNMKNEAIQFLPKVYAGYALSQQYVSEGANVWDMGGISANNNAFSSWNVSAKWDLFASGRRLAKFQEQQIKLQELDILLDHTAQALAIQQSTAKAEFQHALADYQLQSRNVTMAKSILDDTQVKLKAGMATSMAFTQVQSQYQQALSAQLSAAQQALNNHVNLEQALGQSTHSSLND